jgi:transcription initiation factor TFIIIB Brf1 subunit/transcription initiation factor TFIIB
MASLFFPSVGKRRALPEEHADDVWSLFELPKPAVVREGHWCKECDTDKSIHVEQDEVVCHGCGSSLGYRIDSKAEFRYYGMDGGADPTRVGHPINHNFPESSGGTRILQMMGETKEGRRIRQYHSWNIMPYRERSLWGVFDLLHVRCAQSGISSAIEDETKQLYAQVSPLCLNRGEAKEGLMGACLYEALKRNGTPWLPAKVAEIFQIDSKLITKGSKQFAGLLKEHEAVNVIIDAPIESETIHATGFQHHLEPAMARLETPRMKHGAILAFATRIGDRINKLGMCSETTPSSLAASALVLTCEHFSLDKTTAEIARVCSISTATLQKCLKRISKWRAIVLSEADIV